MVETEKGKSESVIKSVLVAFVIALLAGSSAPWWWGKIFPSPTAVVSPQQLPGPSIPDDNVSPANKPPSHDKPVEAAPVTETGDSVEIVAISPSTDQVLPNDRPFALTARIRYRLVSADQWLLVPYLEQFANDDKCISSNHRTIGMTKPDRVTIKRGDGEVSIQFTVNANEHSDLGDRGYVAPNASAWAGFDSQGRVIVIKEGLWYF